MAREVLSGMSLRYDWKHQLFMLMQGLNCLLSCLPDGRGYVICHMALIICFY